jgi:RimJ/RimL family protein N-acetyltransferase
MPRLRMPRPVPVLTGTLVTLRPIDPDRDAGNYHEWNLDPDMHVWTGNQPTASVQAARDELQRFADMDDITMWAIIDNASGRMMGRFFVCLEQRDGRTIAGEGNRVARPFWRKGHNREARRLVFRYVFDCLHADAIETECWTDNVNSRESILAHGFTFVRETTEHNSKHDRPMGKSHFRMTRQDWTSSHERDSQHG